MTDATDEITTESMVARKFRAEALASLATANEYRAAAEKDRQAAEYERGQVEHAKREMQALSAGLAKREAEVVRREREQAAIIAAEQNAVAARDEARALLAQYSADKHAAAKALQAIDQREQAAKTREAKRGKAAA
jgi:hypothetical protein